MTENEKFEEKVRELVNNSEFLNYFNNTIEINYAIFFILFSVAWSVEKNKNENMNELGLAYPVKIENFGYTFEVEKFRIITNTNGYGDVIFIEKEGKESLMELLSGLHLMEISFSLLCNYEGEELEYLLKNLEGNVDKFINSHNKHNHGHEHGDGCGCGHDHGHEHEGCCSEDGECGCGHDHDHKHNHGHNHKH